MIAKVYDQNKCKNHINEVIIQNYNDNKTIISYAFSKVILNLIHTGNFSFNIAKRFAIA